MSSPCRILIISLFLWWHLAQSKEIPEHTHTQKSKTRICSQPLTTALISSHFLSSLVVAHTAWLQPLPRSRVIPTIPQAALWILVLLPWCNLQSSWSISLRSYLQLSYLQPGRDCDPRSSSEWEVCVFSVIWSCKEVNSSIKMDCYRAHMRAAAKCVTACVCVCVCVCALLPCCKSPHPSH